MTLGPPMRWNRVLALDHLTLLDVAPPDFAVLAAGAGFGALALLTAPPTAPQSRCPMSPSSRMLEEPVRRCRDSGVTVLGTEAIRLTAEADVAAAEPALETAARLNARDVNA